MNKYELALVVSANVEDEVRTATIEKVNELITRFGGTITDSGTSEKKKLAYDIQHMSEGFYSFIKFEAEATAPAEIESRIRIMDNVLRFLIVKDGE
jgi:ribosomal protein S6